MTTTDAEWYLLILWDGYTTKRTRWTIRLLAHKSERMGERGRGLLQGTITLPPYTQPNHSLPPYIKKKKKLNAQYEHYRLLRHRVKYLAAIQTKVDTRSRPEIHCR